MNPGLMAAWLYDVKAQFALIENPQTAAYTISANDAGTILNVSGTFALQFPSVKAVDRNWSMIVQNTSTGAITVNPRSGETLDTKTSYVMYGGEARLFYKGATEIKSIVLNGFEYAFSTVGANTFVTPPGYTSLEGEMWPGGNSGSKFSSGGASGGAGVSATPFSLPVTLVGATETVTVGAGGAAVTVAETGGNLGTNSSFGSLVTALASTSAVNPSFTYLTETSATSTLWQGVNPSTTVNAGAAFYGSACGGSTSGAAAILLPGTSKVGGAGGAANTTTSGVDGTAPGGGGGSTRTGTASGAGARGEVRIRGKV